MAINLRDFITTRVSEFDSNIETRDGTPYGDLFVSPLQLILQPFVDQLASTQINQSLRRILALPDPDAYDQTVVDDFGSNLIVDRKPGAFTRVVAKVFYNQPLDKTFPTGTAQLQNSAGLNYFNYAPVSITAAQMAAQVEGVLFFLEIPVQAQNQGSTYNLAIGDLVTIVGDSDAVSVTNEATATSLGSDPETNTQFINRIQNSIGVRDLNVGKGINGILFQNFPELQQIQPIGFKDPEMQRDILFNAHIGDYTDIYLKTPAFQTAVQQFVGLQFDTTRQLTTNVVKQIANTTFNDPDASMGNPFVVFGTVTVTETSPPQAAFIQSVSIPSSGINLVNSNQYIKLQVDNNAPVNIKVSGAVPTATTLNEIINSINGAVGFNVAIKTSGTRFQIRSLTTGSTSQIIFTPPDSPRNDATLLLFGVTAPHTITGFAPIQPVEGVDYEVDYSNGLIRRLNSIGPTKIISGLTIYGPFADGATVAGQQTLTRSGGGYFAAQVGVGDEVIVTGGTGVVPGNYFVTQVVSDTQIVLNSTFVPSVSSSNVVFHIVSNKVYSITYQFNPLTVDIGNLVKLDSTGRNRGIRPGRENFTINQMAFIEIVSIQEIDPDTLEGLGTFLQDSTGVGNAGYGRGGYGRGPYGIGAGQLFYMKVNSPTERYSAFEDSILVFDPSLFGKSYEITYLYSPDVVTVHNFCRSDNERVVCTDILVKNYIPAFVDFTINYKVDPTNVNVPDNATLQTQVQQYVEGLPSPNILQASSINKLLDPNTTFIDLPFLMTARVLKPNGSVGIVTSNDYIQVPTPVLDSQTDDPTTARISHFYSGNIILNRLAP